MPLFDEETEDKIVELRGLYNLGTAIQTFELVKVEWPSPANTVYYAVMQTDEVADPAPPVSPILPRIITDNAPNWFIPVEIDSTIGDEEIDLTLWDGDDDIGDKIYTYGEGVKVTLLYWFPQVELLLPVWNGHLKLEDDAEVDRIKVKAVQGFRSSDGTLPNQQHYQQCQAVFGGLLSTQAEIDEHDCPYNFHIGGVIGNNDPDTSEPWTFCDRRFRQSCIDRGVDPSYHLSHATQTATVVNDQTHGPRLYSTSSGNETSLKEPVRVLMGRRRGYGFKVLNFRRDLNNNHEDEGFFVAEYEAYEGPIKSFSGQRVKVGNEEKPIDPFQYRERLGEKGQSQVFTPMTEHAYSGRAHFIYTFGPLNPSEVGPGDAEGSAIIEGLRDIRVYHDAGQGLLGKYYRRTTFTEEMGRRIDATINFPTQNQPPVEGQVSNNGFCIIWTGQIKPRYSEEYTFTTPTNDDTVVITIDGDEVINATYPSTGSGTKTLVADQLYDIEIRFTQTAAEDPNPWGVVFKWESDTQALEVVPESRLFHGEVYTKDYTTTRPWQIARMMTDKRWGHGDDYERFNIDTWQAAAIWSDKVVQFTDPLGNVWQHIRGESNVELIERKTQQQIEDMCLAGRLSRPFMFNGQICIEPLRALTEDELDACPEFTDEGTTARNIIWEGPPGEEKSTLRWSRKSDFELVNKVKANIDDLANDWLETPTAPVEDVDQQLRAGRVNGNGQRKVNDKEYNLLGVTNEPQSAKLKWGLLDLGPFDEGGLANNLTLKFKIWFMDALGLHQNKVIKVTSSKIARFGFTHFRILKMPRGDDLHHELTVQAYNHEYMTAFEVEIDPDDPPVEPLPPPTEPEPPGPPCVLQFGDVTMFNNMLRIPIEPCA